MVLGSLYKVEILKTALPEIQLEEYQGQNMP